MAYVINSEGQIVEGAPVTNEEALAAKAFTEWMETGAGTTEQQ